MAVANSPVGPIFLADSRPGARTQQLLEIAKFKTLQDFRNRELGLQDERLAQQQRNFKTSTQLRNRGLNLQERGLGLREKQATLDRVKLFFSNNQPSEAIDLYNSTLAEPGEEVKYNPTQKVITVKDNDSGRVRGFRYDKLNPTRLTEIPVASTGTDFPQKPSKEISAREGAAQRFLAGNATDLDKQLLKIEPKDLEKGLDLKSDTGKLLLRRQELWTDPHGLDRLREQVRMPGGKEKGSHHGREKKVYSDFQAAGSGRTVE